ncbi:MAG TPA: isoleucine--tRNA ligase, partial [Longimicrobiaceae bacterium]|nr:isoleucine--tRNA ligase [Longimicrobiaceae bacterium]
VWTTTPWTLVSNVALAVNPELEYAEVEHEGRRLILAAARVPALFGAEAAVTRTYTARELVGTAYRRPFDWVDPLQYGDAESAARAWHVVGAAFVTADDGTGIVHMSPAFGADDYAVGRENGLPVLQPVDDRGAFRADLPLVGGRFVKDADTDLLIDLKTRGLVFKSSKEEHSYPHCWRCGSPLLYMARDSWFIKTTAVRDELLANNAAIRWFPPEVGSGRFGEWLENNVDWALSRSRYWGTPLPAWVCDASPAHVRVVGSFDELRGLAGALPEPFEPHRPFIDEVTFGCTVEGCAGTMRRTPEVIDVWFDSGAMPYAQHHFPFENQDAFARQFPADFICEGVDQTRGWFYSLLAIATLVQPELAKLTERADIDGRAFKNVVVNDLILDPQGFKMSKSKGNVVDPAVAIADHGADAIRWYLLGVSNPWIPKRFDPEGVREVQRKTFDTLRNTYKFFALYAELEGWTPQTEAPAVAERPVIDRWLLSRLASVTAAVGKDFEEYNLTHAVRAIADFVVDDLSNWYVRRSRERFWGNLDGSDARSAYATLYEALVTTAKLMAPVAPFFADWLHRALVGSEASVHLASFPVADGEASDGVLEEGMDIVRTLATLGRAAREEAGIKVRQPLDVLYAVADRWTQIYSREEGLLAILRDELNVRRVEFVDSAEDKLTYAAKPNFKTLGPVFGKRVQPVAAAIRALSSAEVANAMRFIAYLGIEVGGESLTIEADQWEPELKPRPGFEHLVTKSEAGKTVLLDTTLSPELKAEGLVRELVNRVQRLRKDAGLEVQDRIRLAVAGDEAVQAAVDAWRGDVAGDTLAADLQVGGTPAADGGYEHVRQVDLDGTPAWIGIALAR